MKPVTCIHCGVDDSFRAAVKKGFSYVRCRRCGLVYLNPRPGDRELRRFYNEIQNIHSGGRDGNAADARHNRHKIEKFKQAIDLIQHQGTGRGRLLDLGCATGIFMEMAERNGWQAYGTDVKASLVAQNRERFADRVKLQVGHRLDYENGFFDVVTLFDVIEHLPDPVESLKEAARVLRPGGLVVISTPNIDGLLPQWTYRTLGKPFGIWEHPEPPGHLFQFSFSTLSRTLRLAGFESKAVRAFEIFMPYSVGELEEAVIDRIKTVQRSRGRRRAETTGSGTAAGAADGNRRQERAGRFVGRALGRGRTITGKLPRLLVRGGCWAIVLPLTLAARALGRGDAMIVVATEAGRGRP